MIYLDGHSTTPLDPRVFKAMTPYFLERFGNASRGVHRYNWEAEAGIEHARKQVAHLIGAHEKEIVFTASATESNHLALLGIVSELKRKNKLKILSTKIEHSSLLGALEILEEQGFKVEWLKTGCCGFVDLEDYKNKLTDDVGLVSIALANHEIGTIQDIATLSKLAHEKGAFFHSDAVQGIGKIKFTVDSIGVDLMTMSAHKIHGPKGAGALYIRRKNPRVEIEGIMRGGSQERGLRPGTPDTPAIVGFGEAAQIIEENQFKDLAEIARLRDLLWNLLSSSIPCLIRNGSSEHFLPNNLNVSIPGVDGAALFGRLKKVAVSNASACLNGTQDYSAVLTELGVSKALARSTLRFGITRFNTESEIREAAAEVIKVVDELRLMEKEFAEQAGIAYTSGDCT